jgi:hypothetical protein
MTFVTCITELRTNTNSLENNVGYFASPSSQMLE